jgi:two-component system chemotaxis response regulator CheB
MMASAAGDGPGTIGTSAAVRVVVVDGSPFVCRLLTGHLQSVPGVQVAATACDGGRALELVQALKPSVVTLGLELAGRSGLEVLEAIMHECPTPVVVISGPGRRAANAILRALALGAVDFVLKHAPGVDADADRLRHEICTKVGLAARVKVIRSLRPNRNPDNVPARRAAPPDAGPTRHRGPLPSHVVVIGASTGGPPALRELLGALPADYRAALLAVQHLPASFTGVLAAQLDRQVGLRVREARAGECLEPGCVLVAPGDRHLRLRPDATVELNREPAVDGHRPSIDVTMQSVAQVYGARARGVLLTGMGEDGARGLAAIRGHGGKTYAQDAASCVVNGMPQRAIELGAVHHVASPAGIADLLGAEQACLEEGQT